MPDFELIIFDCDGVLVDSERLTNTVFAEMLNELGLAVTLKDMFDLFVGHSMAECVKKIIAMLGRSLPDSFVDGYRRRCRESLEANLEAVKGVREAVEQLTLPYCVASSGEVEKMQLTLGLTGLLPLFEDRLFSVANHGTAPKPSPEIFLFAARAMRAEPARTFVIEDTPVGVAGGAAAGMTVLGYSELMPAERLIDAGATTTFADMRELPGLIAKLRTSP